MAQRGIKEKLCCSICLDILKDPVTLPCGHSYCMSCIKSCWDQQDLIEINSCPQCRQTFTPRPVLVKNTMLADLVEDLKKTGLQAATADPCYAGPGDVACDFCTGRKLKAIKSCLQCLVSYCDQHLQPHYESPAFDKHKLVNPSKKLLENICIHHSEVMKIFCRTDQQCICYLCSIDEHKGHNTVSAAAEMTEKQKELELSRQKIQQKVQDTEKEVKVLQREIEDISHSADKAVRDSEKIFNELVLLIQIKRSDLKEQIRSQQKAEARRVKGLQERLQQQITELKRKDSLLEQLSHTEDLTQFLNNYPFVSHLSRFTELPRNSIRPPLCFESVVTAVSAARDKLQDVISNQWITISQMLMNLDVQAELMRSPNRAKFSDYSVGMKVKLYQNTENKWCIHNPRVTMTVKEGSDEACKVDPVAEGRDEEQIIRGNRLYSLFSENGKQIQQRWGWPTVWGNEAWPKNENLTGGKNQ